MSLVDYRTTKRGDLSVAVLPGTHVRVQWLHENGAIEHERRYYRPEILAPVETGDLASASGAMPIIDDIRVAVAGCGCHPYGDGYWETSGYEIAKTLVDLLDAALSERDALRKENTALRARMKSDAAYF